MSDKQLDIFDCIEIATRGLDGKPPTHPPMSKTTIPTCPTCGIDMLEPADSCGFCKEEGERVLVNEERADRGVLAVEVATQMPHPIMDSPVVTAIEDTLTCIAHSCDRFGLDAPEMFRDALRAYKNQTAHDLKTKPVADGDHMTLREVRTQCPNFACEPQNAIS